MWTSAERTQLAPFCGVQAEKRAAGLFTLLHKALLRFRWRKTLRFSLLAAAVFRFFVCLFVGFVSFRFVSFRFRFCLFACGLCFLLQGFPDTIAGPSRIPLSCRVFTHKFALICCKIISFIYVLPFTWPSVPVDNLFKRFPLKASEKQNLNEINYQTVTLTYRPSETIRASRGANWENSSQSPGHNLEHHVARLKDVKGWPYISKRHQTQSSRGIGFSPLTISCNKFFVPDAGHGYMVRSWSHWSGRKRALGKIY